MTKFSVSRSEWMDKARETALKALIEIETKKAYSNLVLTQGTGPLSANWYTARFLAS
jgi:hypothetical protein